MNYQPRLGDIAADLSRCLIISYREEKFTASNFKMFLINAQKVLKSREKEISKENLKLIQNCIHTAGDKNVPDNFRRDNLKKYFPQPTSVQKPQ